MQAIRIRVSWNGGKGLGAPWNVFPHPVIPCRNRPRDGLYKPLLHLQASPSLPRGAGLRMFRAPRWGRRHAKQPSRLPQRSHASTDQSTAKASWIRLTEG